MFSTVHRTSAHLLIVELILFILVIIIYFYQKLAGFANARIVITDNLKLKWDHVIYLGLLSRYWYASR